MKGKTQNRDVTLLDDGDFFVKCRTGQATGYLMRRCPAPGDTECIGGFDCDKADGRWYAAITTPYDEQDDRDYRFVANATTRLDAICALWLHRHEAMTRYRPR